MAKNTYETLFILDSNQYARDPGGVSKQIEQIISENGGNVLVSRMWMEQRLAYPIDKHQKGTYWLTYFEIEGEQLVKIERAFQLCEPILRELTLKLDPRLVEPMLANARGESFTLSSRGEEEADDSDDNDSDDANAEDDSVVSSEA
ncbi:30S ribosomal protein S6 [Novipirellula caenicola]|uniref:Small ribosomal subunit protein bS6 n=1 Tax=Novipirellula caenicola TaxID=1536901 RepID=A0ABP9VRJ1_9BACT